MKMDNFTTNLIEKLKTVSFNCGNTKSANVLYMLGVENKEVIICKLLASLIELNGLHCLGIEPLKIFLKCINVNKEYSDNMLSNAMVETEELIFDNRRVDIVIHIDNDVIPIEVKLYAKDQDAQLCDYFNYYKAIDKDIDKIYYLTIDGKKPSKSSVGNLKKENYSCISFFKEIYSFLYNLENLSMGAENDLIKIIKDFKEVISNMKSDEENMKEIVEKLTKCFEDNNNQVENEFLQIVKYSDKIWDEVRFLTLKNSIEKQSNNKYSLKNEIKNKDKLDFDKHCKYAITTYDENDEKEVAYLAIEQNLYIVINGKEERKNFEVENSNSDSKIYETKSKYVWKYIKVGENDGKKKWNLKNVDPDISSHIKDVKWEEYIKL